MPTHPPIMQSGATQRCHPLASSIMRSLRSIRPPPSTPPSRAANRRPAPHTSRPAPPLTAPRRPPAVPRRPPAVPRRHPPSRAPGRLLTPAERPSTRAGRLLPPRAAAHPRVPTTCVPTTCGVPRSPHSVPRWPAMSSTPRRSPIQYLAHHQIVLASITAGRTLPEPLRW